MPSRLRLLLPLWRRACAAALGAAHAKAVQVCDGIAPVKHRAEKVQTAPEQIHHLEHALRRVKEISKAQSALLYGGSNSTEPPCAGL